MIRSLGKAVLAALAMLIAPTATAQEAALPKAPLPYAQVRPKAPPARPAASRATPPAASKAPAGPAVAGAAPTVANLPRLANGARLATGQALNPAELEAFVDGWMADAMGREHVAGASVSVVQNGQVILKKGYGFATLNPRKPVDPDRSLFRIGSISKTFTWILLMKEAEAGRIRLDAPVNLYLPDKVRLPGKANRVTVATLMDHTSGFEDRALGQLFERDPRRVRPLDLYLRQERPGRVREPGRLSSYSNYGAALAGAAAAYGSGKSFERKAEEEIFVPLGMRHTTFREPRDERRGLPAAMPADLRDDVAQGYGWRSAGFMPDDYEYIGQIAPAGAASSTAGDMSRYMLMLLGDGSWNGVTVFGPKTAQAFRSPLRKMPTGINGWAHGFMTMDLPGDHKGYGHLGATIAFMSNMTLVPDLGLGVFVTTNTETGREVAGPLPEAIVRHFYAPPATFPRPGARELADAADTFGGYYLTTRRAHGGLEGFVNLLIGGADVAVTNGGRLLITRGGESKAFVPEGPVSDGRFIAAQDEERVAFHVRDGRATSFQPWSNTETLIRAPFTERPTTLAFMASLSALAAATTLIGLALRNRRELRQNQIQARAALVQNIQAGLWIAALLLFAAFGANASDIQAIMYGWPGPLVITASASALVAAALTLVTIAALPAVWQGGRRVDSWTVGRKVFFTMTVAIYTAFAVLLAMNGALEPWSR
ncbi:serine hydrolase domain-containing protein [Phenylobacterium sp.]|uniref:serine hydrolase domain-containing protein n=1 Tax=Phenylobacterium sp. TaxID=1871053 RepID=UPI0025DC5711|nr:serine hydrolase domain-containing protein [Phenylobacterium sp.]